MVYCVGKLIENLKLLYKSNRSHLGCWENIYLYIYLYKLPKITKIVGTLSNYDEDHDDELQKNNGFNDQNNSSARASRFLVHFFDVHCKTTT